VARGYLSDSEMKNFYRTKGRDFEAEKKWKEAEKAYIQVSAFWWEKFASCTLPKQRTRRSLCMLSLIASCSVFICAI